MAGLRGLIGGVLVAGAAAAAPVPVAPPPADVEATPAAAALLRHRKVQKELRLTAEQRVAVIDGLEDAAEEYGKKIEAVLKMPNPPDDALEKAEREQAAATGRVLQHAAAKVLTPAQRVRLRQVDRQVRGPAAFADPDVGKELGLTEAQKRTAADLAKRLEGKADAYLDQLGNDDADNLKGELLGFRAEAAKAFAAALTPDQRAAWDGLLGAPVKGFDVTAFWLTVVEEEDLVPAP